MDNTKQFTAIEWCAGYGGIHLGLKRAIPNLRVIAYGEIEAFACANLVSKMEAGLMDEAPLWSDLKTFPCEEFRDRVDLLVAGYPCQPFSAAGKRLGTEDPRHLWPHIAESIRVIRPRLCFFENVEGHITLGLREVIGELEEIGYKTAWGIFSAREVGAPHQRKRVFIMAYDSGQGLEGLRECCESQGWEAPIGHSGSCGNSWPSRPGEPQHAWEPPRVVGAGLANTDRSRDSQSELQHTNLPTEPSGGNGEAVGNTTSQRPHRGTQDGLGLQPEVSGERYEAMGNSAAAGLQGCGTSSEMDRESRGTESEGSESTPAPSFSSDAHGGEAMGNANSPRPQERTGKRGAGIQGTHADGGEAAERQAQPSVGRDADGTARGMDYAELYTTCDNRTDELRLLGNGVVPATAERAFRTLLEELYEQNT